MEKEADNGFTIQVAVVDDAIIVTMPGTGYTITYRKGADPFTFAASAAFHLAVKWDRVLDFDASSP
jgi:hypothetical protein